MELEFERDTITSYETAAEVTLFQEETLESIVPDACPDILRIVDVCGQAVLSGTQARENLAVVSGTAKAVILYQPEGGGGVRRMEVSLPFSCQTEAPGLTEQGTVFASPRLCSAEARALNPRKVLLRVNLAVDVLACQPVERPVCCGAVNLEEGNLCQRQFGGENFQISAVKEKPFPFTDVIRLSGTPGEAPQILSSRAQAICTESKLIGSKLIFKGNVELSLLLQETGGGLSVTRETLPFSQILELSEAGEEWDGQVTVEVTDLQCQPEPGDGREVEVTLELLAQAVVYCHRPVTLLQDLYSTVWQMETDSEAQNLCRAVEQSVRPQGARELLETGDMVRSIVDSRMTLGRVNQSREGEELVLSAEAWLSVLYLDENELVQCVRRMVPVTCRLSCPPQGRCRCLCQCPGEVFSTTAAGGIEVRFTVEFHCLTTVTQPVPMVTAARFGEARDRADGARPSVVLRLAVPGEGLWELAKTYGTTTEQIMQANELECEQLPEGKMLLIPSVR